MVGGLLGTWQWVAPECIDVTGSGVYDHKSDIYSFGCCLYELAALKIPYSEFQSDVRYSANGSVRLHTIKKAICTGLRPTVPGDTPPTFAYLIKHSMAPDPAQRLSSKEILLAIGSFHNYFLPFFHIFTNLLNRKRTWKRGRS